MKRVRSFAVQVCVVGLSGESRVHHVDRVFGLLVRPDMILGKPRQHLPRFIRVDRGGRARDAHDSPRPVTAFIERGVEYGQRSRELGKLPIDAMHEHHGSAQVQPIEQRVLLTGTPLPRLMVDGDHLQRIGRRDERGKKFLGHLLECSPFAKHPARVGQYHALVLGDARHRHLVETAPLP